MDHVQQARRAGSVTFALATLVALALMAAACSSSGSTSSGGTTAAPAAKTGTNITVADAGEPKSGGTLKVGLNAETNGWSPSQSQWAGSAYIVAGAIFDYLAEYDTDGVAKPFLAQSITPNSDFTEWTIKTRPGVTFQNGQPCDAAALKKNFDAQRKSILTGPVFQVVTSIDTPDDSTVVFTMNQPWSTFTDTMATQVGAIAAPAMIDAPDGGVNNPIGTGPFSFVNWTRDDHLDVKKNPNYWREGLPYLDGITFKVIPDLTSRSSALESGTEDMIEMGDPNQIINLTKEAEAGKLQIYTNAGLQTNETFSALNVGAPPFDDPLARQIVAYGTDRDTIAKAVFAGVFPPALGPFNDTEPAYTTTDMPTFDQVKAKQLADQYKQENGKALEFTYLLTPQPEVQALGTSLQQEMLDIGVKLNLKIEDQPTLIQDVILGNYQASGFVLFGSNTLDVNYVFISDKTVAPPSQLSLNFTRNSDPVLTQALDDARKTSDRDEQNAQYKIVQDQMAKDLNMIFIAHNIDAIVYSNSTHGLVDQTLPDGSPTQITAVPNLAAVWKS
ncbi:MAG: ABC transporter substrate-binding protein [Acidimicrobiales bacterium]